jgi:hypothetical protein
VNADERIAALEAQVKELAGTVHILVESTRKLPGAPSIVEAYHQEVARTAALRAAAERDRAIVALDADARSAAVLEMPAPDVVRIFGRIDSFDAQCEFARSLSDEAYVKLVEALGPQAARMAFALAEPPEFIGALAHEGTVIRTNKKFALVGGQQFITTREEWDRLVASDEDLRRNVEGHPGDFLHFPMKPRITVEALAPEEARREAMRRWHQSPGSPLPPRAPRA